MERNRGPDAIDAQVLQFPGEEPGDRIDVIAQDIRASRRGQGKKKNREGKKTCPSLPAWPRDQDCDGEQAQDREEENGHPGRRRNCPHKDEQTSQQTAQETGPTGKANLPEQADGHTQEGDGFQVLRTEDGDRVEKGLRGEGKREQGHDPGRTIVDRPRNAKQSAEKQQSKEGFQCHDRIDEDGIRVALPSHAEIP